MPSPIEIRPLHPFEWFLDICCWPLMWLLQCMSFEAVQRTHRWNNHHLNAEDIVYLRPAMMVKHTGDENARRPWLFGFIPLFHFACFGGWKNYFVLKPKHPITEEWYPGWITHHAIGVSRLPIRNEVKLLIGPDECYYFGITQKGEQIPIEWVGSGAIGRQSLWQMVPLR